MATINNKRRSVRTGPTGPTPLSVVTAPSLSALNTQNPPGSTQEGTTALVGPAGSRVEYIMVNGAWQVRSVVVIGGAQ